MEGTAIAEKSESQMGRFFLMGQCILGNLFFTRSVCLLSFSFFTVQRFQISSHWDHLQWREFRFIKAPVVNFLHLFAKFKRKSSQEMDVFSETSEVSSATVLSIGLLSRKSS